MSLALFFTGLEDRLAFACRLVRQQWQAGHALTVVGPAPLLSRLDQLLWQQEPPGFLPHLRLAANESPPPGSLGHNRVWLVDQLRADLPSQRLVNLGSEAIDLPAGCERVAELVGTDPDDLQAGRRRWRDYERQGHEVKRQS